MQAFKKLTLNI